MEASAPAVGRRVGGVHVRGRARSLACGDARPGGGSFPVTWDESSAGAALDLEGYRVVFEENFDRKALQGPKIFAPVHSPFGAGKFDGPTGEAYDVKDGVLTLKAYKRNGRWRSGTVQTANPSQSAGREPFSDGKGFACGDCYFEAKLKFPKGKVHGLWGGFWLLSPNGPGGHVEVDVIEWYGGIRRGIIRPCICGRERGNVTNTGPTIRA